MDKQNLWLWLLCTAVLSTVALAIGAATLNYSLAILAGAMFTAVASYIGWRFTALAALEPTTAAVSALFARLLGVAWAWGGAAMLASYYLTDLSWQHAWQYGLGMLLIGCLLWIYAGKRQGGSTVFSRDAMIVAARRLTGLQGIAALAGVAVLALSGKLEAGKQDWAANVVFVAGGLAIFALSMAALRAEQRALRSSATR
jgi:Na+/H+-translocating membrane pyrophosphatase